MKKEAAAVRGPPRRGRDVARTVGTDSGKRLAFCCLFFLIFVGEELCRAIFSINNQLRAAIICYNLNANVLRL